MKSGPSIFEPSAESLQVSILVLSGSSIMCIASAIDPLRAANRVAGRTAFDFRIVSPDGAPVATTCGLPVAAIDRFSHDLPPDLLVVIGGFGARYETARRLASILRTISRSTGTVCGIEAGTWLLGHAGLLENRAATTHWEDLEDFATAFPHTEVRPDRYVIDGPILTAGGASPTFDLMLHLIASRLGTTIALDVASVFIYDQTRAATDAQPLVSLGRLDRRDPRLAAAIRLMETHVEQPLPTSAIARRVGMSTRSLEKIFAVAIGETPGAYGLRLRLNAARRLALDTGEPMSSIAMRTGFSSAASFSRAFAKAFGQSPSRMRANATRRF